jgi:hypothetical protein
VEVKYGYSTDMLVHHMERKYAPESPAILLTGQSHLRAKKGSKPTPYTRRRGNPRCEPQRHVVIPDETGHDCRVIFASICRLLHIPVVWSRLFLPTP